jgi:hypothetical protein
VLLAALLSIGGIALLAWQIARTGPSQIVNGLSLIGWGFAPILVLSLARFIARSAAWTTLIGTRVPLSAATEATLAGDAIGNLTPLSLLVSEPAKSLYLRDTIPGSRSFPALTAENFFYSVSVALFILIGTIAMLEAFDLPPDLRSAGVVAIALMAALLAGALWIGWREPALASATLARLPLPGAGALLERVRKFESNAYAVARGSTSRLVGVVLCEASFHLLSYAESYYTVWRLTGRSAPLAAFVLDTFNRIVGVVGRAVPMRVGVDEYSTALIAPAVGLSPAIGVAIALVRKGRMLVWAAAGIGLGIRKGLTLRDVIHSDQGGLAAAPASPARGQNESGQGSIES